jgi:hypothetical protein
MAAADIGDLAAPLQLGGDAVERRQPVLDYGRGLRRL